MKVQLLTSALFLTLFDISMNCTHTLALPSKVLLATILEFMVKSFILIPKLYQIYSAMLSAPASDT